MIVLVVAVSVRSTVTVLPRPLRATTLRVDTPRVVPDATLPVPANVRVPIDEFVALRAVVRRATTRRALWPDVPDDETFVFAATALRADDDAPRATTRRDDVPVVVFAGTVRVKTSIWFVDCDGVVPGFKLVRILLFIYGYRLLYVFALT